MTATKDLFTNRNSKTRECENAILELFSQLSSGVCVLNMNNYPNAFLSRVPQTGS